MKSLAIIILSIASLFVKINPGDEIDYYPRLLKKELNSILRSDDFKLKELQLPYSITKNKQLNGKFFRVLCNNEEKTLAYVGRVYSCRTGGCSNQLNTEIENEYEYFDYFVLFDSQKRVTTVKVYNYEATHGQEITAKGWLNQFIGFDGTKPLRVGKEVDSISGATISVYGITEDIQQKVSVLQTLKYL